jgi:hypothetical protein
MYENEKYDMIEIPPCTRVIKIENKRCVVKLNYTQHTKIKNLSGSSFFISTTSEEPILGVITARLWPLRLPNVFRSGVCCLGTREFDRKEQSVLNLANTFWLASFSDFTSSFYIWKDVIGVLKENDILDISQPSKAKSDRLNFQYETNLKSIFTDIERHMIYFGTNFSL